ncbi:MAG: metalloregulator ArsR/SmtB family transcription factor [Anaerolineales bacterium]|nr:metalloregulator ArsR/SmtB family transcription factor [Anaerolineales bacterium]
MEDERKPNDEQLLAFFKAMADANRLKIVGLLAQQPYTVEQLSALLDLRPSTISHHLFVLSEAGLVSARAESYYNIYRLEQGALEAMAHRLLMQETLPAAAAQVDLQAYDRKVLHDILLPDGRLKIIPAQRKKREAVLHHIVQAFEPGVRYSEKQAVEILERFHKDTAMLRRELVGYKLLQREAGVYWKPVESEQEA